MREPDHGRCCGTTAVDILSACFRAGINHNTEAFPCQCGIHLVNHASLSLEKPSTDRRQGVLQRRVRHLRRRYSLRPRHANHGEQERSRTILRRRGCRRRRSYRRIQLPERMDDWLGCWQRRGRCKHGEGGNRSSRLRRWAEKMTSAPKVRYI